MNGVVAVSGYYGVVAAVAVQDVGGGVAEDGISVRRAVDVLGAGQDVALGVVARAAAGLGSGPVLKVQVHVDPGGAGAVVRQVAEARAAGKHIGPGPAHQGVVARAADERVVAVQADEMVARGVAREHVAVGSVVAADEVLDADQRIAQGVVVRPAVRLGSCPILLCQIHGHPARAVAVIGEILAKAAVDQVGPGPAAQGVVAIPAEQRVVAAKADKKVGRRVACDAVSVGRTDDVLNADEHVALGVAAGLGGAGQVDVHGRGARAVIHGVAAFLGVHPGSVRCVRMPAPVQGVGARAAAQDVVAVEAVNVELHAVAVEMGRAGQVVGLVRAPDLDRGIVDVEGGRTGGIRAVRDREDEGVGLQHQNPVLGVGVEAEGDPAGVDVGLGEGDLGRIHFLAVDVQRAVGRTLADPEQQVPGAALAVRGPQVARQGLHCVVINQENIVDVDDRGEVQVARSGIPGQCVGQQAVLVLPS